MARPVNADPEQTRSRLIAAAAAHFSQRGLDATSMREVARDAGVTVATINYYFGGKQGLYAACVDAASGDMARALAPLVRKLDQLLDEAVAASRRPGPRPLDEAAALLDRLVRDGMRFGRAQRPVLRLVMRTLVETGELDQVWRERGFVPFLTATSKLLAELTARPALELRLNIQALIALGMRYSLSSPRELARFAGLAKRGAKLTAAEESAVLTAVEDHMIRVAHRLLLP